MLAVLPPHESLDRGVCHESILAKQELTAAWNKRRHERGELQSAVVRARRLRQPATAIVAGSQQGIEPVRGDPGPHVRRVLRVRSSKRRQSEPEEHDPPHLEQVPQ